MTNDTSQLVWFEDLRRTDVALVGGKNASLGEMVANRRQGREGSAWVCRHGRRVLAFPRRK
ncbi:phosphoenolpyruvate synthase [Caballeronia terrestris]|uniref:Phosphoenolpyruvate synthase n=1 Tax=Caballeronia terrestris TaxID=1226301 RepID=A0A158KX36_9BURK|nr:phosphoenolpyruvate synthase [Caballeronia terrestris]